MRYLHTLIMNLALGALALEIIPLYGVVLADIFMPVSDALASARQRA